MALMRTMAVVTTVLLVLTACGDIEDDPANNDNQKSSHNDNNGEDDNNGEKEEEPRWYDHLTIDDVRDYQGPIGEGDRAVEPIFPENYDVEGNHPVLFLLHGLGSDAEETLWGFDAGDAADKYGVVKLAPEGDEGIEGLYWNATDTCCDLELEEPDHVGYLTDLMEEAVENYAVDPEQIYFLGISNGGMMSHRMACDRSEEVAGIISFNGSTFTEREMCQPDHPVQIIHVHGTDDQTVAYDGSVLFPAAPDVAQWWAEFNECNEQPLDGPTIEVTHAVDGDETDVQWWDGCAEGGDVELWTMNGADHVPLPLADFGELMFEATLGEPYRPYTLELR